MNSRVRLVITGTPGVGKHTAAGLVSKALGAELLDINKIAVSEGLVTREPKTDGKGLEIDARLLGKRLSQMLRGEKNVARIAVGHVAPYVISRLDVDLAIVLRRSPYDLLESLQQRGYSEAKARENVASEILGVVLFDSIKAFGRRKVTEIDTTGKKPVQTSEEILSAAAGMTSGGRKNKRGGGGLSQIDWLSLVSERGDIRKFFDHSLL